MPTGVRFSLYCSSTSRGSRLNTARPAVVQSKPLQVKIAVPARRLPTASTSSMPPPCDRFEGDRHADKSHQFAVRPIAREQQRPLKLARLSSAARAVCR